MRNIIVLIFISTLLTGCGARKVHYLTPQEAKEYPVVMIANCDIECRDTKIVKGTIFIVKELGGYKYQIFSNDVYRNTFLMLQKKKKLPDDALFIKLQEKDKFGYIVYPNGKFVYDNYFFFGFNPYRKLITTTGQKCTYNAKSPFILKDNR